MSKKISYAAAIRHTAETTAPHMKISAPGKKILNNVINYLNTELVSNCRADLKVTRKAHHVSMDYLQKIFLNTVGGYMQEHAIAHVNKNLMRYQNGLIIFKPKPLKVPKAKDKKVFPEFTQGLPTIASAVYPGVRLDQNAKSAMAKALKDLTTAITEKAIEIANNSDTLTIADIMKSLETILPAGLAKHAIAEGGRTLTLVESGCMMFDKKDFIVPRHHPRVPRSPTKAHKRKHR